MAMAHPLTSPASAPHRETSLEIGRAAEDYLDWVENHQRDVKPRRGISAALMGVAFALTAATIAAMAFAGF